MLLKITEQLGDCDCVEVVSALVGVRICIDEAEKQIHKESNIDNDTPTTMMTTPCAPTVFSIGSIDPAVRVSTVPKQYSLHNGQWKKHNRPQLTQNSNNDAICNTRATLSL